MTLTMENVKEGDGSNIKILSFVSIQPMGIL